MEGGIHANAPLDFALVQIFPVENRYETFICRDDQIERLASGILEQLRVHLPEVKKIDPEEPDAHIKLRLPEYLKRSAWFTKSTFARFLHIVGAPELLKNANAIGDEMSQLEESRKFHLALYTQGQRSNPQTEEADGCNTKGTKLEKKPELQTTSSDATKNELLRAMDLRLTVLREEWVAAFNKAADTTCSREHIADLLAFSQHFGADYIRSCLFKYLELSPNNQNSNSQNNRPEPSQNLTGGGERRVASTQVSPAVVKPVLYSASPAKVAQIERNSSTESEESSNSSDDDQLSSERSRPLIRSASPRRSASPMRRIQIGRSGSHRAPALTIKSLGFFPAREKISSNKDADGNSTDEESDQPVKKTNSRSISVQDAINLFERKQRDESSNLQRRRFSADTSVSTNKSVLRRWSGRTDENSAQYHSEVSCDGGADITPNNATAEEIQKNPVKAESESILTVENMDPLTSADSGEPLKEEKKTSDPVKKMTDAVSAPGIETHNRVSASLDWSRQKEDELNHMMMKMMEIKPIRNQKIVNGVSRSQDLSTGQRGGSYDQHRKKRDEKVRGEKSGKRAEEQFKSFQEILDQRKGEMASKALGISGKQDSPNRARKPQKKSLPSTQPKSESPKPTVSRKVTPKASSLPATRKSWPSTPSPKAAGTTTSKTLTGISSAGTTATRRKSQPTPLPTQPRPKVERSQKPKDSTKTTLIENKRSLNGQEAKSQQALTSSKTMKTKDLQTSVNSAGKEPAKPSFYNKVTKKGSVVPLESKPFLRKRSGTGPGVGSGTKTKSLHSDESLRNTKILVEVQEEVAAEISKPVTQQEADVIHPVSDVTNLEPEASEHSPQMSVDTENNNHLVSEGDDSLKRTEEFQLEIQPDEESPISPAAWVEIEEHQEILSDNCSPQAAISTNVEPEASSSPRVRHSLSQMLQEDSGEPEILEWGNAENPPAIIYQKDVPKGLKRLLKFARKSKGEANVTGWSSSSVLSEGEEDADEPKDTSVRQADAISRKTSVQTKGGKQKTSYSTSNYGGTSKGTIDYTTSSDQLSAQSNMSRFATRSSNKLQDGHIAASSTKSTRSFFSLSTFRSSK